jgi:WhiB family transcriptional regulator, redox-sensing transcriptional regulator
MDWRMRAACLHEDPELFFPEWTKGPEIDRARQVCAGCPVRARCLDWALSHGAAFGIWGGRTEAERRAMRAASAGNQGAPGKTRAVPGASEKPEGRAWTQAKTTIGGHSV